MDDRMLAEKGVAAFILSMSTLGWFLALNILGVDLEIAVGGWIAVAPLLLFVLMGRVVKSARKRAEEELELQSTRRSNAVLNYLSGQVDTPVRVIQDACDRLTNRCGTKSLDYGRVCQEAATIQQEAGRVRDTLARVTRSGSTSLDSHGWYDDFGRAAPPQEARGSLFRSRSVMKRSG